ncbi:MAG: hypothetical protein LBD31_02105 [Treponema sp.]|nr:hypothetical protein [Treponema sp.]
MKTLDESAAGIPEGVAAAVPASGVLLRRVVSVFGTAVLQTRRSRRRFRRTAASPRVAMYRGKP